MNEEKGWQFPDSRLLTDNEREALCRMLHFALCEVRLLGLAGKAQQASDLADAFHCLPDLLWSRNFSLGFFRKFLEGYQSLYPERGGFDYVKMLDNTLPQQ
jgi:hypothetical protein